MRVWYLSDDEDLLIEAKDKINSAEYLLNGSFYKGAVSRAYYAMYYAARALLSMRAIYPRTHIGVISKFGLEYVKEGFIDDIYGKSIRDAKDIREDADYGLGIIITEEEAKEIVEDAKHFLEKIKKAITEIKTK